MDKESIIHRKGRGKELESILGRENKEERIGSLGSTSKLQVPSMVLLEIGKEVKINE